jgi:protein tyrosine phosphatase (PTP) superfamily phosphohydrolase (DUF442 family)
MNTSTAEHNRRTEGFNYLAKIGVKTVLDLREDHERSSREAQVVTSLGMQYVNVPMTRLTPPTEAEITKILALLEDGTSRSRICALQCAERTARAPSLLLTASIMITGIMVGL